MGFWDTVTDLVEAATPWSVAEAEAPAPEEKKKDDSKDKSEESKDEPKDESKDEEEGGEEEAEGEGEGEGEDEEEEEEEEEVTDPKEQLEEDCKNSKQCAPSKHHFDECVERVTKQEEDGGAKEDCVEEYRIVGHHQVIPLTSWWFCNTICGSERRHTVGWDPPHGLPFVSYHGRKPEY
ncbi:hypothetical protein BJ170DRAFT_590613 [Xylariales sp. AK1849]|nr:hypothetical protein BJ170DRAFT_590613 [Xylariales sp. AK1849]